MSKNFHIGDILSITTSTLLSPSGIRGVYAILEYMTGDLLFTHQLIRVAGECRPYLLKQLPRLVAISTEDINEDNWQIRLDDLVKEHGEYHEVKPLPAGAHVVRHPLKEAEEMAPGKVTAFPAPDNYAKN